LPDRLYDSFKVRHHLFIGETQNPKAFGGEESVATSICFLTLFEIVRFSVELNDEL